MLHERIQIFIKHKPNSSISHKFLTEKDYKTKFNFLKEVDSKALQSTTRNLMFAFRNYYNGIKQKRTTGLPKYKSSKNKQSYTTYNITNNLKIDFTLKKLKLPKIKSWIKFHDDRKFDKQITHVTVSKTKTGKYFASIHIKIKQEIIPKDKIKLHRVIAFDMSASKFLVSKQIQMKNPRFFHNEQKKLRKLHKYLSRKKLGSNNREKARFRLARKYEKIHNRKLDWTHKISTQLSKKYEAIILEDLNIKGMQKFKPGISKSITLDFSWNQFFSFLAYKMKKLGNHLITVNRWFPSSKICSICGVKLKKLKISVHEWKCKECGSLHDRDINASKNLYTEGLKQLKARSITLVSTVGTTESYACGDDRSLSLREHSSMNQESNEI